MPISNEEFINKFNRWLYDAASAWLYGLDLNDREELATLEENWQSYAADSWQNEMDPGSLPGLSRDQLITIRRYEIFKKSGEFDPEENPYHIWRLWIPGELLKGNVSEF